MSDGQLGVLFACFSDQDGAGKARRALDRELSSHGQKPLDTVVLKVNEMHRASVHDPRRVLMGTLTPALTWGLLGLLANGWEGLLIWAVVGAACGGALTYYSIHNLSKDELRRIGTAFPARSSALLTFVETNEPQGLLVAASAQSPSVASVAAIADDLRVEVLNQDSAGADTTLISMILTRYPDPDGAAKAAARLMAHEKLAEEGQVVLVVKTDGNGRRHVANPKFGAAASAKSDIVSWGVFGVVVGAIAGAGGGGIVEGGVVSGIAWAVCGAFAGSLYGLWAGRSVSARRLKSVGKLFAPGTSAVLAWARGPAHKPVRDTLAAPGAKDLVLHLNPVETGAVIAAGASSA
ncbi:MAG: hypothetical protein JST31_05650 [Actinobacteria bacterium]|nr:hypothetical protein [Actinomycetota bacterium]